MDNNTYLKVFNTLIQPIPDPEVIVVSGILKSSGQFTFRSSFNLPNRTLTPAVATGDLTVSILDENNHPINSVTVQTNFTASITSAEGSAVTSPLISIGSIPLLVELPGSPSAETIEIASNHGAVISKASVNSQLLLGIVADIPDNAFKARERSHDGDRFVPATPAQIARARAILTKRVAEIQKLLNSKNAQVAALPLRELIKEIKRLTFDNYTVANAAQLTQAQVVLAIEDIIYKIERRHKRPKPAESGKSEKHDEKKH